jgi:hypothetical protein
LKLAETSISYPITAALQEQEEEAINALHKQLLQFYKETNFKVGF